MALYDITSAKSGKNYRVDFESEPSHEDVDAAVAHLEPDEKPKDLKDWSAVNPEAQPKVQPATPSAIDAQGAQQLGETETVQSQVAAGKLAPQKTALQPEGFVGTALRELGSKIAPAAASAVGGLLAGTAAAETGPGAILADMVAGTAAGTATEAGQRKLMGDEWSDENIAQMEANAREHPHAAALGGALPFILSALGGGAGLAKGAAKGLEGAAARAAERKAAESALASATGFARAGGAEEGEKAAEGQDSDILGGVVKGGLGGGLMHFVPGSLPGVLGGAEADAAKAVDWPKIVKDTMWRLTGKSVGDATTMVVANKAYDSLVNGKPFTVSDILGDSAAASVDFALFNAIHAGFEINHAKIQAAKHLGPETVEALQKVEDRLAGQRIVPQESSTDEKEIDQTADTATPQTSDVVGAGPAAEPPVDQARPDQRPAANPEDTHVVAATYTAPDGTVHEGENHIEAAAKAGVEAPQDRQGRETPEFGFKGQDTEGRPVPLTREEALEVAKRNGQLKPGEDVSNGKLHSDQIDFRPKAKIEDVKVRDSGEDAFRDETEARQHFDSTDPDNGGVRDVGRPENFREYLLRMVCRGYSV